MCGIVGYTGQRQATPILIDGLRRLEYRGYDSAGVAVEKGGALTVEKASGLVANLAERVERRGGIEGACGIAHTRWATHGAPTDVNAHPHVSEDGHFAVVHNGIIENFAALREELRAQGFVFRSETDTEVIAHLLELYYEGDLKTAVMRTAARLEGSYALGVVCALEPGRLFAVKEASPLIIGVGVAENFFASDVTALVPSTKNVIYLEDGEFAELTPERVTVFDRMGAPVQKSIARVVWDIEAAEKGGYEHFMLKEIMEQPRAVKAAIEPRLRDGRIVPDSFDMSREELERIDRIIITACGSAYYAGCVGKYVIESLCRIPVETAPASELRYCEPVIDDRTLVIVLSQSGETADSIAALRESKARGARTLAIVNVVGSTIAKLADDVIYTNAGPEIAVATTKGYTTQVAVLDLLAVWTAERLGRITGERYNELIAELRALPAAIQRAIDLNVHIPYLAERYCRNGSMFFIGRNLDNAVGLEGSLKLKEISYIHSEAYAAGELKHGTIALIDKDRLVVALCCCQRLFEKLCSNVEEVKARGARVLALAQEGDRRVFSMADDVMFAPRCDPLLMPVGEIVPLQLFAYYVAKENGCAIDKPRNLAKSVTVE